ncbi:unnamed protein product, partial [Mesorhabditis spiculigera]
MDQRERTSRASGPQTFEIIRQYVNNDTDSDSQGSKELSVHSDNNNTNRRSSEVATQSENDDEYLMPQHFQERPDLDSKMKWSLRFIFDAIETSGL